MCNFKSISLQKDHGFKQKSNQVNMNSTWIHIWVCLLCWTRNGQPPRRSFRGVAATSSRTAWRSHRSSWWRRWTMRRSSARQRMEAERCFIFWICWGQQMDPKIKPVVKLLVPYNELKNDEKWLLICLGWESVHISAMISLSFWGVWRCQQCWWLRELGLDTHVY